MVLDARTYWRRRSGGAGRMPGRRLTGADRREIAAGLARGLDYAGIARLLGRPTSTVSREVARNGGPGRYRADLAQLATTHRARRRPRPQAVARRVGEHRGLAPELAAAFVADFTAALVATGLPRTAAGALACLSTSETGSRTAAELARELGVSAATTSHAVGLLLEQGLVRRERETGSRRYRYSVDEDAGFRSAVVGARANQRLAATALRGADVFGTDTAVGARLAAAGRLLDHVGGDIIRSARHWRAVIGGELGGPFPGSGGRPGHLVVADEPGAVDPPQDHAQEHRQRRSVGEAEVDGDVAEHDVLGEPSDFEHPVVRGQAERLAVVVRGHPLAPDGVGAQALEDRVLGEGGGDPLGVVRVDARLPLVEHPGQDVLVVHGPSPFRGRARGR